MMSFGEIGWSPIASSDEAKQLEETSNVSADNQSTRKTQTQRNSRQTHRNGQVLGLGKWGWSWSSEEIKIDEFLDEYYQDQHHGN